MKKNILIACGLAAMASLAQAAPVPNATLTGGGANWSVGSDANGFTVHEATFAATGQSDSFDDALTFQVNGAIYNTSGGIFDHTGQTATGGIATLSGLSVHTSYTALTSSPTLRTLFTLTNSGSQAITATVSMLTNVGSDGSTQVIGSSDGNTSFNLADRWLVTDDSTTGGDPANLHVLWGLGGLLPTSVSSLVFDSAGTQGVRADFQMTLAAGQTSSLLMFNQIQSTAANALAGAADFSNLTATDARLADLTTAQRASIVNWNLGATNSLPEPTSLMLVAIAGLAVGATRRRKAA